MANESIIQSALRTEIFSYVAAMPHLRCCAETVRKQMGWLGYVATDIDEAITALETEGSLYINDDDMVTIGLPLEDEAA